MKTLHLKNNSEISLVFVNEPSTNWANDIASLTRLLAGNRVVGFSREDMLRLVSSPVLRMLAAIREYDGEMGGKIVGVAIMAVLSLPEGREAQIRNLVCSLEVAGQGVEEAMINKIVAEALQLRADRLVFDGSRASPAIREALSKFDFSEYGARMYQLRF